MLQRFRILRAMQALGEFTVDELATASGAELQTVRTTLRRVREEHPDFIDSGPPEPTGRRGGAWIRYRLEPAGAAWLEQEVARLTPRVVPPPELLAAEDMLLNALPRAQDDETREWLCARARRRLAAGRDRGSHRDTPVHVRAIELLLRLADAEAEVAAGEWRAVAQAVVGAEAALRAVETPGLYDAMRERVWASALAEDDLTEEALRAPEPDRYGAAIASALAGLGYVPAYAGALGDRLLDAARTLDQDVVVVIPARPGPTVVFEELAVAVGRVDCDGREVVVGATPAGSVRLGWIAEQAYLVEALRPSEDNRVALPTHVLTGIFSEQNAYGMLRRAAEQQRIAR